MRPVDYKDQTDGVPGSLLAGMEKAVCATIGVRSLRHRSALLELTERDILPTGVVEAAYKMVARNWKACRAQGNPTSRENWRWRAPQLAISGHNTSPEVVLERALIAACERAGRLTWANQVPVASGVAGPSRERRRAIDLVCEKGRDWFEFIELKVASDTPLYAAIEIIGYTCIWLVSREGAVGALLAARRIDAVVLAPQSYYARYRLNPLQNLLHQELQFLGQQNGVELSFSFQSFPDVLMRRPFDDEHLLSLLDRKVAL